MKFDDFDEDALGEMADRARRDSEDFHYNIAQNAIEKMEIEQIRYGKPSFKERAISFSVSQIAGIISGIIVALITAYLLGGQQANRQSDEPRAPAGTPSYTSTTQPQSQPSNSYDSDPLQISL